MSIEGLVAANGASAAGTLVVARLPPEAEAEVGATPCHAFDAIESGSDIHQRFTRIRHPEPHLTPQPGTFFSGTHHHQRKHEQADS
ncbi:hypothetical protein CBI38_34740 (plasmid) [Rhodococcus oxybenzonivorans]|uniref:Uncharacterized protein n=1 Tax=Rhodococcus oxybenzonivorans TaxID=1990687 RepID=A0A2S2C6N6_9NOCA|nr:hypothetical protein CBI38_34740 [Rhodococcus oxybenzonivorans]